MKTIKELIGFTDEELETIVAAGKLLREAANRLNEKDAEVILDEDSIKILETLREVVNNIVGK